MSRLEPPGHVLGVSWSPAAWLALERRLQPAASILGLLTRPSEMGPSGKAHAGALLLSNMPEWGGDVIPLVRASYSEGGAPLQEAELRELLFAGSTRGTRAVPPFAVAGRTVNGDLLAMVDDVGLRQAYWTGGAGWAAFSTSPRALAVLRGEGLDLSGLSLMAMLGYPLQRLTIFAGVSQLGAGSRIRLHGGAAEVTPGPPTWPAPPELHLLPLSERIRRTANLTRAMAERYLDERQDLVLELSGGLDSRLLLAAIPHGRRRGLKVFTLRQQGSADAMVAERLSANYDLNQHVVDLEGFETVTAGEVGDRVAETVRRFECSAEPLGHVVLDWAEAQAHQGARVHGLGGEIGRGFYYGLQPTWGRPTPDRVDRLARWRLFPNGMMDLGVFEPDFAEWVPHQARAVLHDIFSGYDMPWLLATDEFYLRERLGRWAGNAITTPSLDRHIISPLFDPAVIDLSYTCPPEDKRGSKFMAGVVAHLDPGLAAAPLAGGAVPLEIAHPNARTTARQAKTSVRISVAKVQQRLTRGERPTVGASSLVSRLVESWRAEPDRIVGLRTLGVLRESWIDQLLTPSGPLPSVATIGLCAILNEAGALPRAR